MLMAAYTTGKLARLEGYKALHTFDRHIVFVKCHEKKASHSRHFKISGTVRLNRDSSQYPFEGKRTSKTDWYRIDRFCQLFEYEQFFYFSGLYTGHITSVSYVHKS
ncbi:unnamed protein product [marine sediment metagenome]|uniref:Uncharacterized protein n=1 Tax=marine sediment metagenome TaxID=412755 RepID=X0WJJ1_9ZZZZ